LLFDEEPVGPVTAWPTKTGYDNPFSTATVWTAASDGADRESNAMAKRT
jgi:hypothetical protein